MPLLWETGPRTQNIVKAPVCQGGLGVKFAL